jgi:murein hydrolase activator
LHRNRTPTPGWHAVAHANGVIWWVVAVVLAVAGVAWGADETIEDKEETLRSMEQEMEQLSREIGAEREQRIELEAQLRQFEEAISRSAKEIRRLTESTESATRRFEEIDAQRRSKLQALASARNRLAAQLRAAYALGRQDRIKLLLNQEDPTDLNRLLAYHDYLTRSRTEQVALVASHTRELAELLEASRGEQTRLQGLRQEREREQGELAERQAERKAVMAALDRLLDAQGRRLRGLETDATAMRQLIETLQREAVTGLGGDFKPIGRLRGRLPWPVKGSLEARFGAPKESESIRWDGVFIAASEGAEVRAVHIGRVVYADWLRGFGLLLILDHGEGYMTLYGHNQTLLKEVGEWVQEGEPMALVGDSGGAARAGLYFGIRHQGKAMDPTQWCAGGAKRRVGAVMRSAPTNPGTFSPPNNRTSDDFAEALAGAASRALTAKPAFASLHASTTGRHAQ